MDSQDLFIVQEHIKDFLASKERALMIKGEKYYKNENDILKQDRKSKIPHAFMFNLVDEKVQYLLGKEPTLNCTDTTYLEHVKDILGDNFLYKLQLVATEASNKAIAWEQVYFNDKGELKLMLIPSEQIIPVWKDNSHRDITWIIRVYEVEEYKGRNKEKVTKVEVYTDTNTYFYILDGDKLLLDSEKYLNLKDGQEFGHFTINGEQYSFGRVPFVFCKNNAYEMPDLKLVKGLIDAYDSNRSNLDELLEDFKNFLLVIKNYAGDTQNVISLDKMLELRRIFVEDDGDVKIVTPSIDTQANESHNSTLKDDIILFGRSVDRNKMTGGNAPSGIALKTLYSGLDLKCNKLEIEIKNYFKHLMYFVEEYLKLVNINVPEEPIDIILNRDITMNESDAITDCKNSVGVISNKTIVANHPWVNDVEEELNQIESEDSLDLTLYSKGGADEE